MHLNHQKTELESYMNAERRTAIKALIDIWNQKDTDIHDFYATKDHHCKFNRQYPNEAFQTLWEDYIVGLENAMQTLGAL